jgi:ribosomal-protein-alanine N-acetyltransferase
MSTLDTRFVDRPLTDADIASVIAMERQACVRPAHAWSEDNYRSSLRAGYWARVRCEAGSGRVLAVCVAMDGVDEVHLLNIAVDQSLHGLGVARQLLGILYARSLQRRVPLVWLEVRPSNTRALALYARQGFVQVGVRKRYYPAPDHEDGREDALVMRLAIPLDDDRAPEGEAPHALD